MSKTYKIALALFLLLVLLLTYLEVSEPQPVNWNESFSGADKIPLGSYVLYENLQDSFVDFENISIPPYEFLNSNSPTGTYFFLNDGLYFDDDELDNLLEWVSKGNTLFLSAENFSSNILDTLKVSTEAVIPEDDLSFKPLVELAHPKFIEKEAYLFDHESYLPIFKISDSATYKILGNANFYQNSLKIKAPKPNYLHFNFGKGKILLHSTPKAFSNFFLLTKDNVEYAEKALAYLPEGKKIYWDQYYKTGKSFHTSPLYILLNNKPLKWAYYFALFGCLLFILFEGKRKQRSIPVVKPLENQTVHFTRTISGLYLDRKDYKKIASKKITLFLEFVRTTLRISTSEINAEFYQKVASRSGNSEEEVKKLFAQIRETEGKNTIDKNELLKLNSAIEDFKNNK
ncbi:DUF4350 domain-containing protein [Salinimicrobium sp. GXAS 041]|uniref:DUF4350 domain-containing protein n=1 Tax=Salinimicrobium sp. GXAS 041 TaxID=3400806 RepID=UPI003C77EEA7